MTMAAPNPEVKKEIRERRRELCMDCQALNQATRIAQNYDSGVYVNITDYGKKTHGISKGDEVIVETHEDGIVIKPINDDE